jgi:hypothetical protein
MADINRANPYLSEIIQILDMHLEKYQGDTDKARDRLTKADNDWIDQEILHCITEPRYFISNFYAIRTEDKGFQGLYPLFDSQEILHDEYRRLEKEYGKVRALVLKARQMGSTTYNCAEFFHKTIFAEHVNSLIVGQDEETATYIMGMYESALDFIPWWMRPRIKLKQAGKLINFDERDEALRQTRPGLKTWVYADNANKPTGVGRSKTFGRALLSELSFWANGSQLSKALFPTMNTADGFYIMESTANGRNDFWHNLWRRAEAGKIDWHPIFIPFYRREKTYSLPLRHGEIFRLTDEEAEIRDRVVAKDGFIVKDETFNWMRNKKEEFIATDGDDMMFQQEFTSESEESFQSSAITAFPRGIINRYSKRTLNPFFVGEISYDWKAGKPTPKLRRVNANDDLPYPELEDRFHVWDIPQRGAVYTMGVDVSLGNLGSDYSVVQVIKTGTGHQLDEQVACWHGLIDPTGLAEIVFAIGWWYNEAMAAVEVNSMGMVTNNELVRNLEYENIYRFKRMDRLKHFMTDIIGFWTDEKSKRALMAKMSKSLQDDQLIIRDKFTIDEFRDFTEDGALGEGAHDDLVMSLMIAVYCAHEGEESQRQQAKSKEVPADANHFKILDRWGTMIAETTSMNESQRISGKHPGSTIVRTSGATATVTLAGTKHKIPSDYQSTDVAVYEIHGTAKKMYEEGVQPEDMTPEAMAEFEDAQEELDNDPENWKWS